MAEGASAFRRVWPRWKDGGITAVVTADDIIAFGVLTAAQEHGLSVPTDVSVASYNDIEYSRIINPSLTSVDFGAERIGAAAAEILLELTSGREAAPRLVGAQLHERASTGLAPIRN